MSGELDVKDVDVDYVDGEVNVEFEVLGVVGVEEEEGEMVVEDLGKVLDL